MNIFITGGTSGVGEALAIHYAKLGHTVGVCSHEVMESKPPIHFYQADVTNLEQVRGAISEFVQHKAAGSRIDLVIANAGISYREKKYFQEVEESLKIVEVNTLGVINTFAAAMDWMLKQKSGHIVAMGSVAGHIGLPTRAAYSASKAAVNKWCESMAIELATKGITVSCVAPGFIKTPLTQSNSHVMPFALDLSKAVEYIVKGIERKKFFIAFPWQVSWVVKLLSFLPRSLYISIMKRIFSRSGL